MHCCRYAISSCDVKQIGMVTHQKERKEGHTKTDFFVFGKLDKSTKIVRSDHLNTLEFNSPLVSEFFAWVSTLDYGQAMSVSLQGKVSRPRQYPHKRRRQMMRRWAKLYTCYLLQENSDVRGEGASSQAMKAPCPSNTYWQTKLR